MTRRNRQRILDVNAEAEKHPLLVQGMDPWYVMDPLFKRMAELMGPEKAKIEYLKMNTLMGMASPGSEVLTEIPRGTAAYFLQKQGRFPEFVEHLGKPEGLRGDVPSDIINVPGHMYHQTAQATPMSQYLESGELQMKSPKVPMYIQASQVPEIGFQTRTPVGDAHWSRAVGLADTRGARTIKGKEAVPGASVSNPEMTQLAPWWREEIANELGIEAVPAQGRTWGVFSGQTGVTTPIGAPKLELLAQKIMETAQRLNVSPETARDMVIMGETYAGKKDGGAVYMAEGGQSRQPVDRSLPDLGAEERLRMEDYLRRMRFTGGGSGDKYGTGVGGRAMVNFPVGPAVVQPYVGGGVYKPQGGKLTGGVSEAGVNLVIPFAGGGIIKRAGQIIGKAAQSSGMAPPVTATKNLTTLQDIHTSLGDRIRENALEAQKQMESFDYKYDKGQRVFTQDSAAKNKPPYTILGRTRVGNRPMTEDGTIMGKKIIDPETGKTKRTPYEPGYRVRYENGDDWSEFDIPATAIMGDVEMAKGGQVSKDAMWIALQNKQLRKKHGN